MKKFLLTIFIISILLLPVFAFADLGLEQTYPGISQGEEITLTGKTSIAGLIKYFSTWAIIIAILVTIISLIVGGFEYLASAGRPQAMTDARKRITKAFLGLAILTSSYLILRVVNPQIHLLRIKKVPVSYGIVALTSRALNGDECEAPDDPCDGDDGEEPLEGRGLLSAQPASLEELVELNQARYLTSNILDMTKQFGRMVVVERDGSSNPLKLNFEDFQLYAIGFWGKDAQNMKVKTYSEKGLQGDLNEYTVDGKINWDWEVLEGSTKDVGEFEMDIVIIKEDFVVSSVDFADPEAKPPDQSEFSKEEARALPHPPLSIVTEGIGPGVYLYSDTSQRYFTGKNDDLGFSDFDDEAIEIEIKNTDPRPDALAEKHNYLAILYDDTNSGGSLRIFFEQEKASFVPRLHLKEDDFHKDIVPSSDNYGMFHATVDLDDRKNDDEIWSTSIGGYLLAGDYIAGNVPKSNPGEPAASRIAVNAMDQYGKVSGVSSIDVYDIARPSACREVRLCTQKFGTAPGMGYCISYTNQGKLAKGRYDAFNLPMPWYAPVNIPAIVEGTVQIRAENGERTRRLEPYSDGLTSEEVMFKRNIRSIEIDGKCLVVLFKNPVDNLKNCLTPVAGSPQENTDDCWKKDTPDANSEVFTGSDSDLTDNPIGTCSARDVGRFGIGKIAPCAAAIAVFPIK